MKPVIVISSLNNGTYFFSTDHCQEHKRGMNYIPSTYYNTTKDEIVKKHYTGSVWYDDKPPIWKEIPNPQSEYQA